MFIIKKIISWFTSQPSSLELFILSKHPTNAADIEHWTREFQHQNFQWGRGL